MCIRRLSQWLSGKQSTCNAGVMYSIPGSGRSPGGGNGNPFHYSCLKIPMDQGAWWAMVHRVAKSQTWLSTSTCVCVCVCVCVYVYFLFVLSSGLLISLTQLMLTECPLHGVPRLGKAADRKQNEIHFQSCSPEGRQMFEPWLGHTEYPMPLDIVRNQCLFQPWSKSFLRILDMVTERPLFPLRSKTG